VLIVKTDLEPEGKKEPLLSRRNKGTKRVVAVSTMGKFSMRH